jgi:hypothetical protein
MNAMGWVTRHAGPDFATYVLTDRLHRHRPVRVTGDLITTMVSIWLAHLDTQSVLAEDFARSVRRGDWTAVHAIADALAVDVTVAA